ncbi:MAG: NAD/NADP octopine/nopaline dehydrogenase family protein [Promethearchaeota archaeon]
MKFCVIGAGSGGQAFAAYLSSKGYQISLYNRSYSRIAGIKKAGGITAFGCLEGFYPIELVTQNLKLAVSDAGIILIVVPASAHESIAKKIAPFLKNGQILLLNPGRTFGAIEVKKIIRKRRKDLSIFVGETQTLLFTCRALKNNGVNILKIKNSVNFSTFPDCHVHFVHDKLVDIFPQLIPIDNYLEVTLNNIGMLLHPAITLFNVGMMDMGKPFKFYNEGASIKICQVLEIMEYEVNKVFSKLGLRQFRFSKWAEKSYGIKSDSIYEAIQKIEAYKTVNAPNQLITRYLTEDVPTGLVPISSLAEFLNVEIPTIESIILLTSLLCGVNFKKMGRSLQKLGIHDYLINYLNAMRIRELEKEGLFTVEKILSNPNEFKICISCEQLNYHENDACWLCHDKNFRYVNENDFVKIYNNYEKSLIRA